MEKVVTLRGLPAAKLQADVIEELEWLLEAAKSGELAGFAYAGLHADRSISTRFIGRVSHASVGGLVAVTARIVEQLNADE